MRERQLTPDMKVTELGFGGAGIANLYGAITDDQAAATVDRAWDLGIRYFDTAPHYGLGLSERRLGEALRSRPRDEYVLSTKVGRLLVDRVPPAERDDDAIFEVPGDLRRTWDFSESGIRRSLEESLARLGTDHVDILFLHDPDVSGDPDAIERGAAVLTRLRDEGMVKVIGIGSNDSAAIARAFRTDIDTALVAGRYTLLRNEGMEELLEAAGDRRVILAGVFNSGLLATPDPSPDGRFDYGEAPPEVLARARALADAATQHGTTLPALAIAHALGLRQAASVVLGMSSPTEVEENLERYVDGARFDAWNELPLPPTSA